MEGKIFGKLFVVLDTADRRLRSRPCECSCECGKLIQVEASKLKNGRKQSCGCINKPSSPKLIGTMTKGGSLVIKFISGQTSRDRIWLIKCLICGNEENRTEKHIKFGVCNCSGCYKTPGRKRISVGDIFTKWTVISDSGKYDEYGNTLYLCECSCVEKTRKLVPARLLLRGERGETGSQSCGCYRKESAISRGLRLSPNSKYRNLKNRSRKFKREWNSLVKYTKKRDNHKCYICDDIEKLEIHHMNSWKDFEEQRYDEENLITLCVFCHNDFHAKHGIAVVKQDFLDYISGFKDKDEFLDELRTYKNENRFEYNYIDRYLISKQIAN